MMAQKVSKSGDITLSQAINSPSKEFQRLNPHLFGPGIAPQSRQNATGSVLIDSKGKSSGKPTKRRSDQMNKLEGEYARILQAKRHRGEIIFDRYEALKLRIGDKCFYSPDFLIIRANNPKPLLVEIKGAAIHQKKLYEDGIIKFKAAKELYPCFDFEMWSKIDGEWVQIR